MFGTVKEVDEETIIKEHMKSLSRDNTTSLQADNVEDLDYINDLLIFGSGVTKKENWTIEEWKCLSIEYYER